ncbi:Hypothetical predicted protein [Mytilus galloprovincialis]|uniref:Uncharacterized protein n=1 Tax=Mytilus galloprovincialis TaxID=29158 RepID=A0A8B6EXP9_MYTGA|nr:Hypothetical predicted protein [Mytilus galloprovincialis]
MVVILMIQILSLEDGKKSMLNFFRNEANNEFIDEMEKLNSRWKQELSNIDIETGIENEHTANAINDQISLEETKQALRSVKLGKAVGIDNLPNEILRNDNLTNV